MDSFKGEYLLLSDPSLASAALMPEEIWLEVFFSDFGTKREFLVFDEKEPDSSDK